MIELSGVTVAVIGLGISGEAAARLALAKGAEVYVSDSCEDAAVAGRGADLRAAGASVQLGGHDVERLVGAGLVVVSPGIPPDAPVLRVLADRGVRWISEPELAARLYEGSLIAVTGTNGKTTVTLLVEHLLRAAGMRAAAGGNVGGGLAPAASDLVRAADPPDWCVLEMSSFQLAGVETFHPTIGVVTNLSPDHLDRYATVEEYYADKARLFDTADHESVWVLPAQDDEVERLIGDAPGARRYFGEAPGADAFVVEGALALKAGEASERLCAVEELPLLGRHNVHNALAAALVARLAGAEPRAIAAGLRSARALPHRLQPVVERDAVLWVNDSKATNVAATRSALASLDRPVVLLLGGTDKGEDFAPLARAVSERVRVAVVYGEAAPRLVRALEGARARGVRVVEARGGFDEAVRLGAGAARHGEVLLLSPACSSYDMFESYEERGRRFVELAEHAT